MTPPEPVLDLKALDSHSPSWSPELRFAVCLATAHAARACYHRVAAHVDSLDDPHASALPDPGTARSTYNPHADDDEASLGAKTEHFEEEGEDTKDVSPHQRMIMERVRLRRRHQYLEDWDQFSAKFIQAICQHLGVPVHALPPADDMSEHEVFRHVRGASFTGEHKSEQASERGSSPGVPAETATEADSMKPDGSATEAATFSEESKEEDTAPTGAMVDLSLDENDGDSLVEAPPEPMDTPERYELPISRPGRPCLPSSETPLDQDTKTSFVQPGQEVEVVHELVLVALGLGQYRASDGATMLFEQDDAFEDEEHVRDISAAEPATHVPHHARGPSVEEDAHASAEVAALETRADDTPSSGSPLVLSVREESEPVSTGRVDSIADKPSPLAPGHPDRDPFTLGSAEPTPSDEGNFLTAPPLPSRTPSPLIPSEPNSSKPSQNPKPVPPPLPPRLPPRPPPRPSAASASAEPGQSSSASSWAPKKLLGSIKKGFGKRDAASGAAGPEAEGSSTLSDLGAVKDKGTAAEAQQEQSGPKPKEAVKPNELFHYDARSRAIIFQVLRDMGLESVFMYQGEKVLAQSIHFLVQECQRAEQGEHAERGAWMNKASGSVLAKERSKGNWGKWAAAGVGFTIAGVLTGGLAAPLLAPMMVGLGAGVFAGTGGVVLMGTLLGLGGGGLAGYKVQRRLRGLDRLQFDVVETPAAEAGLTIPSMHATICVSGLLTQAAQQTAPWKNALAYTIPDPRDIYAVEFETELMVEAGSGLQRYVTSQLIRTGGSRVATEVIKTTAFAGLAALTLPLTVMSVASAALDSTFVRAKTKAHKAGLVLAETLRNEVQGHRPVILIGTSLGVTTIISTLVELAKSPGGAAQLVDSVYLIGGPTVPSTRTLKKARSVVARRFVNAYSSKDMVCGVAAWLGSGTNIEDLRGGKLPRVMGSGPIELGDGADVENIDVSEVITSHEQLNHEGHLAAVLARCNALVG